MSMRKGPLTLKVVASVCQAAFAISGLLADGYLLPRLLLWPFAEQPLGRRTSEILKK